MTDVCCALIMRKSGEILVAQRGAAMRLPLKWEFPGGKVETGETAEACIVRESEEELSITVKIIERLTSHVNGTGSKAICLIPFLCEISGGEIRLTEHAKFMWLFPDELSAVDWAEADLPILNDYLNNL